MESRNGSQNEPASSGVIRPDYEYWVDFHKDVFPLDDSRAMSEIEYVFYSAYMLCYNRLMNSLREAPLIAAAVTATMRDELNTFFEKSSRPPH